MGLHVPGDGAISLAKNKRQTENSLAPTCCAGKFDRAFQAFPRLRPTIESNTASCRRCSQQHLLLGPQHWPFAFDAVCWCSRRLGTPPNDPPRPAQPPPRLVGQRDFNVVRVADLLLLLPPPPDRTATCDLQSDSPKSPPTSVSLCNNLQRTLPTLRYLAPVLLLLLLLCCHCPRVLGRAFGRSWKYPRAKHPDHDNPKILDLRGTCLPLSFATCARQSPRKSLRARTYTSRRHRLTATRRSAGQ